MLLNYQIKKDQDKYVIYKNKYALHLPCKLMKKKRVEFSTKKEAEQYIQDIAKLIKNGEEYIESY
tara:strand:- start:3406 stop:3600 length:195 start_codon:yes stop_codon:yes gene_type:complete